MLLGHHMQAGCSNQHSCAGHAAERFVLVAGQVCATAVAKVSGAAAMTGDSL